MNEISFLTPVAYSLDQKTPWQTALETVEDLLYVGGEKAYSIEHDAITETHQVVLLEESPALISTALKVLFIHCAVIPALILFAVKAVMRSMSSFQEMSVTRSLAEGIDVGMGIQDPVIARLHEIIPRIQQREESEDFHLFHSGNSTVFTMPEFPRLIFKYGGDIYTRHENILNAKKVVLAHRLDHLKVPQVQEINGYAAIPRMIVQEKLDIRVSESAQERMYYDHADRLETAATQFVTFIAKTGFSDVEWRNNPILNEALDYMGDRTIGLIDLEEMRSPASGVYGQGYPPRRGLVGCLGSEELIDRVVGVAQSLGVYPEHCSVERVKQRRLQELEQDRALDQFYLEKGIADERGQQLVVDVGTLGLDLEQTDQVENSYGGGSQTFTMREVVTATVDEINRQIAEKAQQDDSVKGTRKVYINTNQRPFVLYNRLGGYDNRWMSQIITALIDQRHIFRLDRENGHGYFIQA